jgi:hypothetical protein
MATTKNPQAKASVNVPQGPRTGNAGTPSKRNEFKAAKSETGSERSRLADFVMNALTARGNATKPAINPGVEGLSSNSAKTTGISKNPTANGSRAPAKNRAPKSKG